MPEENPVGIAKDAMGVVADVLRAAGDDPQVKEAASNLGRTAVTLTKTINNVLVPLAAINFAFDKARAYYADRFPSDMAQKAQRIPIEHVVEPKASIAGPALQGLAFTHEEPDLKEMYLNLLATSMDGRSASTAHPAFVEIIKQLDAEDARAVRTILTFQSLVPIGQIIQRLGDQNGFIVLMSHVLNFGVAETRVPAENPRGAAMVDNLIRLGLVEVDYKVQILNNHSYQYLETRPELIRFKQSHQGGEYTVEVVKGVMRSTALGKRFATAIGLNLGQVAVDISASAS